MFGDTKPKQGVILGLWRIDPALMVDQQEGDPREAIRSAFDRVLAPPEGHFVMGDSLGRWDLFVAARVPPRDFHKTALLPDVPGLKKVDIQYGYGVEEDLSAGFQACLKRPFWLVAYLHVRDDVTLRAPLDSHVGVVAALGRAQVKAAKSGITCSVIRMVGWPDFAVLAASNALDALLEWAKASLWEMPIASLGARCVRSLSQTIAPWRPIDDPEHEVVFCRTFTAVCLGPRESWDRMDGSLDSLQVDMRVRAGADGEVARVVAEHATADWAAPHAVLSQPGSTDITLVIRGFPPESSHEAAGHERSAPRHIPAASAIPWYVDELLPALAPLVTTSELRVGVPAQGRSRVKPLLRHRALPVTPVPDDFLKEAEAMPAGRAIAGCIRSMCRLVNTVAVNDALYAECADVYLHTRQLLSILDEDAPIQGWPQRLSRASALSALFSVAVDQRLCGSYYSLTEERPDSLLEHVGGQQKLLCALWGLQDRLLHTFLKTIASDIARVQGYWVVSPSGEPGSFEPYRNTFVYSLSSPLTFDLAVGSHAIGHELGHAAYELLLTSRGSVKGGQLWIGSHPEELSKLKSWKNSHWRAATAALLSEVFSDAFSFLLFLGADIKRYQTSFSDFLQRVDPDDGFGMAEAAIRAWLLHLTAQVYPQIATQSDGTRAAREYGTRSADDAPEIIPIEYEEVPYSAKDLISWTWDSALIGYGGQVTDRLKLGWNEADAAGWLSSSVLDCLESCIHYAVRASACCLGYRAGEGLLVGPTEAESGLVKFLREVSVSQEPGSTPVPEHTWVAAMVDLERRIAELA